RRRARARARDRAPESARRRRARAAARRGSDRTAQPCRPRGRGAARRPRLRRLRRRRASMRRANCSVPDCALASAAAPAISAQFLPLALGALTAVAPMATDIYLPGMPALADDLGVPAAGAQLTLSAFFFGFGGGQLLYGPLADRFGRRPLLLAGLSLFTAASLGCALAQSLG